MFQLDRNFLLDNTFQIVDFISTNGFKSKICKVTEKKGISPEKILCAKILPQRF